MTSPLSPYRYSGLPIRTLEPPRPPATPEQLNHYSRINNITGTGPNAPEPPRSMPGMAGANTTPVNPFERMRGIIGSERHERFVNRPQKIAAPAGQQTWSNPTDFKIAQYARQAGFTEAELPMAVAIARAESGGNYRAENRANTNGTTDRGLWQINSVHKSPGDLYDPAYNAQEARRIYQQAGNSWTPWSAYKNGAYQKFLQPVKIQPYAVSGVPGSGGALRSVAVENARAVIGLPYQWGGNSLQTGVDCSGLVKEVYEGLGLNLPRTAHQQSMVGSRTNISNLRPGDLVAWQGGWRGPNYVGHIAVYAGNGQIIEAPRTGLNVRQRALKANENVFGVALKFPGD